MIRYSLERALRAVFTIWGVITIVFVIPRLVGDPAAVMAPITADAQAIEIVRASLGLDKPIIVQYWHFLRGLVQGDMGMSYLYHDSALGVVLQRFPATLELAAVAMFWAVITGIPLGILSAIRKGSILDQVSRTAAVLGQSMPPFWTALVLLLLFAVRFRFFPVHGPDSGLGSFKELILPSVSLGWWVAGPIARLTRSAMLEEFDRDYVTMARMKGLSEGLVVVKHALRNALIPVLTFVSIQFAYMLGGVVIIEAIFSWPGLGRAVLQGIFNWDFPLVQAATILGSTIFVATNFLVDVLYGVVDPRIRY